MNQAQAQRTVIATTMVVAAIIAWDNIKRTGKAAPSGRSLVGLLVLAAVLAVGASVAPDLFGPLALLIGLAVVVSRSGSGSSYKIPKRPVTVRGGN